MVGDSNCMGQRSFYKDSYKDTYSYAPTNGALTVPGYGDHPHHQNYTPASYYSNSMDYFNSMSKMSGLGSGNHNMTPSSFSSSMNMPISNHHHPHNLGTMPGHINPYTTQGYGQNSLSDMSMADFKDSTSSWTKFQAL